MTQEQNFQRKLKGKQIALTQNITKTDGGWKVPSETSSGHYFVLWNEENSKCNCPDHELRHCKCKHIYAVEFVITNETDENGVEKQKVVRKTYTQNWPSYNLSQQQEKKILMVLLADLTEKIEQPTYGFGRPTLPLGDMIYSMVFKVYSTFSGRRFNTDLEMAEEKGYLSKKPHYNSVFNYFGKEELTPLLVQMVCITSLPLSEIEKQFAIDSTGFGTGIMQRWFSYKHGRDVSCRRWVKCHFITGVDSNIITSVKITHEFDNDHPQLQELVPQTQEHFDMQELSADKAYLSKYNLNLLVEKGIKPYIPFRSNNKPTGNGLLWKKLYHQFHLNSEEFLQHYHKRSNVESTVSMMKRKFGDKVRSKTWTAQVNEVLCKVIAHNICVVIQEMHTRGIKNEFLISKSASATV